MNKTSRNYFLLAIILFIYCNGYGQNKIVDSSGQILQFSSSKWGTGIVGVGITVWSDSTVEVEGDTTKAILFLFRKYQEMEERYWAARMVVDQINLQKLKELFKSKYFNSSVSYYLKTEKKYNFPTTKAIQHE